MKKSPRNIPPRIPQKNQSRIPFRKALLPALLLLAMMLPAAFTKAAQSPAILRHFAPLVTNYTDSHHGAALQNWSVATAPDGRLYVGNNEGLLSFDGYSWSLSPLPSHTILRSLLCTPDRIYAGTFEDFGYFSPDPFGRLTYHSLIRPENGSGKNTPPASGINPQDEEFWQILQVGDRILFQSFDNIYWYDPASGRTEKVDSRIVHRNDSDADHSGRLRPLQCFVAGTSLYAQRAEGGFYRLGPHGWVMKWPASSFGSHIKGLSFPPDADLRAGSIPDNTLIFTEDNGIYRVSDGQPVAIPTDPLLRGYRINRVLDSPLGDSVYIGTVGGGIFHIDRQGKVISHLSTANGLHNNTVLGMAFDTAGNLWAALDDGISLLRTSLPLGILHPGNQQPFPGVSYGVAPLGESLVVATNQGAYNVNPATAEFSLIPGTKGQNWMARSFDSQTIIGGNERTVILSADGKREEIPVSGTNICRATIHNREVLLQSSYYDLLLYTRDSTDAAWHMKGRVDGLNAPVRHLEVDADGTVWCARMPHGLIMARISPDFTTLSERRIFQSPDGSETPRSCAILKIRGKVVIHDGSGFYTYDHASAKFIPHEALNRDLGMLSDITGSQTVDDDHIWIAGKNAYTLIAYSKGHFRPVYSIPFSLFPRKGNGDNPATATLGDHVLLTLNEGVACVNQERMSQLLPSLHPSIASVTSYATGGDPMPLPVSQADGKIPVLPTPGITLAVSYPPHINGLTRYRFHIEGNPQFDTIVSSPVHTFGMLPWGKNRIVCDVIDAAGNELDSVAYSFRVLPPWPLRWWAFLLYAILIFVAIKIVSHINLKRAMRKRRMEFEQAEAEKDRRIREQELIISRQEKQLLESQLSEKSKELASMALGEYGRRQAIDSMRESLADKRRKGAHVAEAERVLQEIAGSEGDNRLFWDIFEKNFDLIHEHFFRNLRKAYPTLTPVDLRFCALLRMNMSSKDISKFTNLSLRGVETARYRLRKKLALPKERNLVEFLIEFAPDPPENQPSNPQD